MRMLLARELDEDTLGSTHQAMSDLGSTHSWLASSTKTRATRHADAARHHGQIGEVPDSFAGVGFGSVADVLGGLR